MKVDKIFIILGSIIVSVLATITIALTKDTLTLHKIYQDLRSSFHILRDPSIQTDGGTFVGMPFLDFTLKDMFGKPYCLHSVKAKLKIIVLFNTEDCPGCLEEYRLWKKIDETYADDLVSIIGINNDKSISSLISFIEAREIRFPVLHDPDNIIKNSMRLRFSPLRIILDGSNKIIDIGKPGVNLTRQREILSSIGSRLKELKE
jgi:thiol-disulfide isomerase/thioredoxin